jgi:hypothetical protein
LISSVFISTLYYPSFWIIMAFVVATRNVTVREYEAGMNPAVPVKEGPKPMRPVWGRKAYTN